MDGTRNSSFSHAVIDDNSSAIVAIPSKSDPIWEMSSETVPHMTILFMSRTPELESTNTLEYIQHVASNLTSFGLNVAKRGVLGPDDADVVFFGKSGMRDLIDARAYLLDNQAIRIAYDSVEQYPEWTPHLTMGYSKTPAKETDFGGPYWISFDRLALWTKDSQGYEFELQEDDGFAIAEMSGMHLAEDVLKHHGIKGMKWGVRKSGGGSARSTPKAKGSTGSDHLDGNRKDNMAFAIAKSRGTSHVTTPELKALVGRLQLEKQFNELTAKKPGLVAKGAKAIASIVADVAQKQAKAYINNMVGEAIKGGGKGGGKAGGPKGPKTYQKVKMTATPLPKVQRALG